MPENCLVTGAGGFIGTAVCRELIRRGHRVVAIDDLSNCLSTPPEGVDFFPVDICEPAPIRDIVVNFWPRYVFHLAARRSVMESFKSPWEYWQVNVTGTANLLRACTGLGGHVRRFVLASSSSVYGGCDKDCDNYPLFRHNLPDRTATLPRSPYAASKLGMEALADLFATGYETNIVNLRYHNVYGPGQPEESGAFFPALAAAIHGRRPLTLYGDGNQTRHWTHVEDVARLTVEAGLSVLGSLSRAYNIAGPEACSLNKAIAIAERISGKKAAVYRKPARVGEVRHSLADHADADRDFGSPMVDLESGIASCVQPEVANA